MNNFYFENYELKECKENEIIINTSVLGLCGSDVHKFLKQTPKKDYLGTKILGHEISGTIVSVGKNVSKLKKNDRVVVNPFRVTSDISKCESFSLVDNMDIVGRTIDGGYAQQICLPKECVYKLPDSVSNYEAIFIDDIAVALHGIHYIEQYRVKSNNIAIIGDGPLGLLCYRILKQKYKKANIVLFSKNIKKLEGLNINAVLFDDISKYENIFDVVLEAVGGRQSDTLNKAIMIGASNCLILCYGVFQFGFNAELDVRNLFYKQGVIKGINSYCNIYDDFNDAIKLLESKKIIVDDLITSRVAFDDAIKYIKGYSMIKNNIKTVFEVKL